MYATGRQTLKEVRDGSGDSLVGTGQVEGPSRRSGMGWGTLVEVWDGSQTLREVRDGSVDRRGGPGQVGGPSGRSGTGRGTIGEARNSSGTLG